jgi:hypothetical protein
MTSKSECNNEVTGPQADVSGMYPRNALQAASNPKSHVLRQIEFFYHTGSLPFSLEGNELNAESGVLHRNGDMTAQERSRTKRNKDRTRISMSLDSWSPLP